VDSVGFLAYPEEALPVANMSAYWAAIASCNQTYTADTTAFEFQKAWYKVPAGDQDEIAKYVQ
jgi:hypothetical protein